eukprot:SAG31_NODE_5579_length_2437_cov_1.044719_1_plen_260_part_01
MTSEAAAAASKIVIAGAGLHGSALAYYLTRRGHKPVVIERHEVAGAASGKGGGFLARDWGSGPTDQLHKVSFALHAELAKELGIDSYRKVTVLSVDPGSGNSAGPCPWLDGPGVEACSVMDADGGAQVDPRELCTKLMAAAVAKGAELKYGTVEGIETTPPSDGKGPPKVSKVKVSGQSIPCSALCVTMGPWSSMAEDWFGIPVPITGVKSTSIVYDPLPNLNGGGSSVEPYALFCGEDNRFGTHLEVYPRASGDVYICG